MGWKWLFCCQPSIRVHSQKITEPKSAFLISSSSENVQFSKCDKYDKTDNNPDMTKTAPSPYWLTLFPAVEDGGGFIWTPGGLPGSTSSEPEVSYNYHKYGWSMMVMIIDLNCHRSQYPLKGFTPSHCPLLQRLPTRLSTSLEIR